MKNNRILAIAINNYDDVELNAIQNCEKDVTELINLLTSKYTFDDVDFIHEKKDTARKALYNKLKDYFINRLDDENVLLVYAGHGQYNPELEVSYWQPSDSDPLDSSTWISISEILAFVRASKAFHISIISDSCFSGAMFETPRGGGIKAFETKKSRLALTSGSIETVSDGEKDQLSPFAKSLIIELEENENDELPFSILGNNILMKFNEKKKQTPMFGPLNNVGHNGGSFIFKLKKDKEVIEYTNSFLEEKMRNLFITVSDPHLQVIEELKVLYQEKISIVKAQQYEKAAGIRDKERKIEQIIFDSCSDYIDSFYLSMTFDEEVIKKSIELDKAIEKFKEEIKNESKIETEELTGESKEPFFIEESAKREELKLKIKNIFSSSFFRSNPELKLFRNSKDIFVADYKNNVLDIYRSILKIKGISKSEYLENKANSLKEIIINIYKFEVQLLTKGSLNDFDELISIKELDMDLINWIRNE